MIKTLIISLFLSLLIVNQSAFSKPKIKTLAELQQRPGNPAVGVDGTVYFSMHPFDNPEYKIMVLKNDQAIPYPNEQISSSFTAVIGIQATQDGLLWWLDMGSDKISPKLIGWDTKENRLKVIHVIPKEVCVSNSFLQDFAIDEKRNKAYIADMSRSGLIDESQPAIVIIDLNTGQTRRVLSGHKVFQPGEKPLKAEGQVVKFKDEKGQIHDIQLGLNPIAIDPSNDWVYFASMTPGNLYRMSAKILGDFFIDENKIEKAIEIYSDKPSCDGIAVDHHGVVYITNVDENAISISDQTGTRIWIKDQRLIWPDGLYLSPDKSVIATVNQLNRDALFNEGQSLEQKPYTILKITD